MTLRIADRIWEHDIVTGTGTVALGQSIPATYFGFGSINGITAGDTFYYVISDPTTNAVEEGIGTYAAGNTFARTTVLQSSNAGSLVSFAGNSCSVFLTVPSIYLAALSSFTLSGAPLGQGLALDPTLFAVSSGTLTLNTTPVGSLPTGTFTTSTQVLISNGGTPAIGSMTALAAEVAAING